jgi:hypothetical protein
MHAGYDKLTCNLSSTSTRTDPSKLFPTEGCSCESSGHLKQQVPPDQCRSYYLQRNGNGETVEAFPDGLRVLAGNPYLRSDPKTPESQAITWNWSVSL